MRSNRMFWAILLIGLGFLFLANNLGLMSINVWGLIWPAFLILLGISFLMRNARGSEELVLEEGSIDLEGAEGALVTVKHGAGKLVTGSTTESGKLATGTFANGLDARVKRENNQLIVVMQPKRPVFPEVIFPWNWVTGRGYLWDFGFTKDIPLNLVFEIGAVDAHLDFTDLQVKDVVLKTGASSTNLTLPAAAGLTHVKIEAGAAAVNIRVPEGVAARVESTSGLVAISVDQVRFPKINGIYQSADYESTENKVNIRIEAGVGSIEIH
ncbi:MAG: cell wall-active antibiotics response protein [Anaerolineales bacterium]|nr:cell wall-active antibiotics response protein [Anaerolineales bacterium]